MDTLVASVTDHRNVADCPRSIDVGSAVKDRIDGAAGGGGGGGASTLGGGGGGGGGVFFLQPTANNASIATSVTIQMTRNCLFRNMNLPPEKFPSKLYCTTLPHTGLKLLPCVVKIGRASCRERV